MSQPYDVKDIDIRYDELRTHDEISRRAVFSDGHLINARMSSKDSLLVNQFDTDVMLSGDSPQFERHVSPVHDNTFPMLLKLIHGSVIDSGIPDRNVDNDNISADSDFGLFPTMSGVAEKAAKESGNRLDGKQMIVYETICATFLLSDCRITHNKGDRNVMDTKIHTTAGSVYTSQHCHRIFSWNGRL